MSQPTSDRLPGRIEWFAPWTWRRRSLAAWAILGLLVVYAGAIGPAVSLAAKNGPIPQRVAEIYRPLLFIRFRCETVAKPLDFYAGLWSRHGWYLVNLNHLIWYEYGGPSGPALSVPSEAERLLPHPSPIGHR